ncbi:hypothetical protein [Agrococcus beijingensis]|uniref:hypothetical protein n=1 Tax=Agrococcus beijingensis TaxID=3068634 RepID=UPI002740A998|nr:hypothetical protein [Agrococcus sp. REN33]
MSAVVRASGRAHLRLLGSIAGALFGAAGIFLPFAAMQLIAVVTGVTALQPDDWVEGVLTVVPPVLGAALSVLWLRRAGVERAGRVTALAGLLSACLGWFSLILLTPVMLLLGTFGVLLPDTSMLALLPWIAAALGALGGFFFWRSFARTLGSAREPIAVQPPPAVG